MTQRERNMATVLGIAVVVGGGLYGGYSFYKAIAGTGKEIDDLKTSKDEAQARLKKVRDDLPALNQWRRLSLHGDLSLAAREYRADLRKLTLKHELIDLDFPDQQPHTKATLTKMGWDAATSKQGKLPLWTGINYTISFKAKLATLVAFIKDFQNTPRMHRIKSFTFERVSEKEGELLAVRMSFEALSILEAEQVQQKAGIHDGPGLKLADGLDAVAALRHGPAGLGFATWAAGPKGPSVAPLNPPLVPLLRKYSDIALKNFFVGFVEIKGSSGFDKFGKVPPDDVINTMRFNRFIRYTVDQGKVEAGLWDASTNTKTRVRETGGFNRFPLLQTVLQTGVEEPVVQAEVVKIEKSAIIFRVALKASDPKNSKWWRYPMDNHFYSLHHDDFSTLAAAGKVRESDRGNLFLVNQAYWDNLTTKGKDRVELDADGRGFRFVQDFTRGDIVYSDREVLIVRLPDWPPPPLGPSVSIDRIYPDPVIYRIQKNHFADLLADKDLTGTKKLKADEIDRVYAVRTAFWDLLAHQKVVFPDSSRGTFTFYGDLVKGDVISRTEELVVLRVAEKYCHCPGDKDLGIPAGWHEGFCVLRIDRVAQDALMEPLSEVRVKEFLKPAVTAAQ